MSFLPADTHRIVNVASVKHRSPFRYPGGKTWLVPRVRRWLLSLPKRPSEFFEPFAGGAIVALTVAAERLADHVTLGALRFSWMGAAAAQQSGQNRGIAPIG